MPSGKIHSQDSIIIATGIAAFSIANSLDFIPSAIGALTGIILSPDLDQDDLTISELSIIRKAPAIGWLFYLYWFPYAKIIPHRHWSSHWPVVGTLGRILYLTPLWYALSYFQFDLYNLRYWLIGLALSDLAHWLRDSL